MMKAEKNLILYDDSYLGEGYFIIHPEGGEITKFLKLYVMNNYGFPNYGLRAFSVDGRDNPDYEFNNIEFIFSRCKDFDNDLFDAFLTFSQNVDKEIYTIDRLQQGRNHISITADGEIVKLVVSKDVYRGTQHSTDFIDINLGDDCTCENYEAITLLYQTLAKVCHQVAHEKDIKKLLTLKIK